MIHWASVRRLSPFVAALSLCGCQPVDEVDLRDPEAIAVTVDGRPLDCALTQTIAAAASAEVRVAATGELTAWLADEPLEPGVAWTVQLEPDVVTPLLVTARQPDGTRFVCDARLVHRAAVDEALSRLDAESAGGSSVIRSDETGAPAHLVLRVGTSGDDPSSQAADFLMRHAASLGVSADQLVEESVRIGADGWARVRFAQVIEGVPGYGAGVTVELDPDGIVVGVDARVFVGLSQPPMHVSDAAQAEAAAQAEVGPAGMVQPVVFDPVAPRAAWDVRGELSTAVVDDATLEVERVDSLLDEAPIEIHRPDPDPIPPLMRGASTGWAGVNTTRIAASAPSESAEAPPGLSMDEARAWSWTAEIANRVEDGSGTVGWSAGPGTARGFGPLPRGHVRLVLETQPSAIPGDAFYLNGMVYLGSSAMTEAAVVCHEYGHALHRTLRGGGPRASSAINEAVADVFWVFCDPWLTNQRRSSYRGQSFSSPPGPLANDYDAFRASGRSAGNLADGEDFHGYTYFLSSPFYWMVERYGTPAERAEQLAYYTLEYYTASRTEEFRAYRDAIVQQADRWARSGHPSGFDAQDACNVARAFRDIGLDGEYGMGTDPMCGGVGTGTTTPRDSRYICTGSYCPLCPVENDNPCDREPSADEPHCVAPGFAGAGDRRICVGALAITDHECERGSFHHCWCTESGWECSSPCQDLSDAVAYCPERGSMAGGYSRTECAIGRGRNGAWWIALLMGLLVLGRRVRPRRRRTAPDPRTPPEPND